MPDPKMVSEREAVDRVRSAVRHALYNGAGWGAAVADAYVNREHPRSEVERPRVVEDRYGDRWKWENDRLWRQMWTLPDLEEYWEEWDNFTTGMRDMVDDLRRRPNELVDEDA